jgi:hypothetical protein
MPNAAWKAPSESRQRVASVGSRAQMRRKASWSSFVETIRVVSPALRPAARKRSAR